jgi:hypothetical protein
MPCSVEMPAGTGKTEIIAAVAAVAAEAGERALVLTHTNAGVDALRRRVRLFGVAASAVRIETIASWSHHLVRHYPQLAGLTVAAEPNWDDSRLYYDGAQRVASTPVMRRVLQASYTFVIVDEYQDCTVSQHGLITSIGDSLPLAVFGDPLQSIFDFDPSDPLITWNEHVRLTWQRVMLAVESWRWRGHNETLGEWLIKIRDDFDHQRPITLDTPAVRWIQSDQGYDSRVRACRELRDIQGQETIVAIGNVANDCHGVASKLQGTYTIMETFAGKDMILFARKVDHADPHEIAAAVAQFGKDCATHVADFVTSADVRRLSAGRSITGLKRPGGERAQAHLSRLLTDPTASNVHEALIAIGKLPGIRRYRHDAWSTVLRALAAASAGDTSVEAAVVQLRNRTRAAGRPALSRVISRTTLIKGLEYDHAVILNADAHEPTSLYVALTRARKTLTIISESPVLRTAVRSLVRQRPPQVQHPMLWDEESWLVS